MSWQDYVDNQLLASQCVTKACIAGHDGNVWAQSSGFERQSNGKFKGVTTKSNKNNNDNNAIALTHAQES